MLEMAFQREKCETFFLGGEGGHGSGPPYEIAPEKRGRHSPSTPLVMKVTSIVYNPPFQKFLDPPLPNKPAFDRASSLVAILVSRNKCIFVEKGDFFIRKNTHVKCVKQ